VDECKPLYDGRCWHRDMENHTEVDRPMLYLTYAREWYGLTDIAQRVIQRAFIPRFSREIASCDVASSIIRP